MDIRIENRNGFSIKGYLIETLATDESYDAKSIALREHHEKALRKNSAVLYGATWFTADEKLYYLFGSEQGDDGSKDSVNIPSGVFAVATVPHDMQLIQAWVAMWEEGGLPSTGYSYIEAETCFEVMDLEKFGCLWRKQMHERRSTKCVFATTRWHIHILSCLEHDLLGEK